MLKSTPQYCTRGMTPSGCDDGGGADAHARLAAPVPERASGIIPMPEGRGIRRIFLVRCQQQKRRTAMADVLRATLAPRRRWLTRSRKEALWFYLFISPWFVGFLAFLAGRMAASAYLS